MMPLEPTNNDIVSVIIPTYNSAKNLPLCIRSIKRQKYQHKEILVVDNYSTDETQFIAENLGANLISHRGNQAAARNMGLARSKGEYILFLDSDQQLDGDVIEDCVQKCSTQKVTAVKIPEVFVGLNFWSKCSVLWKNSTVKASGPQGGVPRFYTKKTLLKNSAFNDNLRWWEDAELYQRLKSSGLKEAWCKGQLIHHENDPVQSIIRKYLFYGQSVAAFKGSSAKAPIASTFNLTLSTMAQTIKDPGRSPNVFLGCWILFTAKAFSGALGFLSRLRN